MVEPFDSMVLPLHPVVRGLSPELPSDDSGATVIVTGVLAALTACFFAFWVLGGYRFFIGRVEDLENPWDLVRRSVSLVIALFVTAGLFLGAV